eukprot:scaffold17730_cov36-Phaeocystis_antarctica.AAC.1
MPLLLSAPPQSLRTADARPRRQRVARPTQAATALPPPSQRCTRLRPHPHPCPRQRWPDRASRASPSQACSSFGGRRRDDFRVDLRGLPESAPVRTVFCPVLGRGGLGLSACEGLERALRLVQLEMRHATKPAVLALLRVRQQLLSQDRRDELRRICLVELAQHERKLQVSQLPGAHSDRRSQVGPKQKECLQTSQEAGHPHLMRAL